MHRLLSPIAGLAHAMTSACFLAVRGLCADVLFATVDVFALLLTATMVASYLLKEPPEVLGRDDDLEKLRSPFA